MWRGLFLTISLLTAGLVVASRPPGGPRQPTLWGTATAAYDRSRSDEGYHGTWTHIRPETAGSLGYWESTFQFVPKDVMDGARKLSGALRANAVIAASLDLKLRREAQRTYEASSVETWAFEEQVFLAKEVDSAAAEREWSKIQRKAAGYDLPTWASGRVKNYLRARVACDALLLAGAMRSRDRANRAAWSKRWLAMGREVAAITPSTWEGAPNLDAEHYPALVNIERRRFGLAPFPARDAEPYDDDAHDHDDH